MLIAHLYRDGAFEDHRSVSVIGRFALVPQWCFCVWLTPLYFGFLVSGLLQASINRPFVPCRAVIQNGRLFSRVHGRPCSGQVCVIQVVVEGRRGITLNGGDLRHFVQGREEEFLRHSPAMRIGDSDSAFYLCCGSIVVRFVRFRALFREFLRIFRGSTRAEFRGLQGHFAAVRAHVVRCAVRWLRYYFADWYQVAKKEEILFWRDVCWVGHFFDLVRRVRFLLAPGEHHFFLHLWRRVR